MSENVPISPKFLEVPAAQSVFCKDVFPGRIPEFPKLHKSVLGFPEFPFPEFPEFVPEGLKKHLFFIHL
jgi:hypothetical protein